MTLPPLVLIESPFKAPTEKQFRIQYNYLVSCVRHSIGLGESPYCTHGFFTQFLDDNDQHERMLGIRLGLSWGKHATKTIVYEDLGISTGMRYGIEDAINNRRPVERRLLGGSWERAPKCSPRIRMKWPEELKGGPTKQNTEGTAEAINRKAGKYADPCPRRRDEQGGSTYR